MLTIRLLALCLGIITLELLASQLAGSIARRGLAGARALHFGVFTFWANTLIGLTGLRAAFGSRWSDARVALTSGAMVLGLFVAVVYHGLLTELDRLITPEDFEDAMQHSLAPLAMTFVWIWLVPHGRLRPHATLGWVAIALAFGAFALVRGALTGRYPYFLIDAATYGYPRVALNIALLSAALAALGLAAVAVDRRLARRR